ncbi:MAG: Fic family protein [Actinomycetes bacterium]
MQEEWIPGIEDYLDLAEEVLGADRESLRKLPNLRLAESALAAPFAEFGGTPAYEGVTVRAAELVTRLARNHPLPDGNKRAAFLTMATYLRENGLAWDSEDIELDAGIVERIASGVTTSDEVVAWIDSRTSSS